MQGHGASCHNVCTSVTETFSHKGLISWFVQSENSSSKLFCHFMESQILNSL